MTRPAKRWHKQWKTVGPNKGTAGKIVGPGRGKKNGGRPQRPPFSDARPTIRETGITKDLSSRAQKKAAIPKPDAERLIEQGRENIIKGRPAKDILQARREEKREERMQADRAAADKVSASYTIYHAGVDDVTPEMLGDAEVHAVITDPPYPEKYLPAFSSLSSFAARVLKPGGWCVIMTGSSTSSRPSHAPAAAGHLTRWRR